MMTGSLKQAKHSALPRGLISRTNLPLIRLRLFVHLVLFSAVFTLCIVCDAAFCGLLELASQKPSPSYSYSFQF